MRTAAAALLRALRDDKTLIPLGEDRRRGVSRIESPGHAAQPIAEDTSPRSQEASPRPQDIPGVMWMDVDGGSATEVKGRPPPFSISSPPARRGHTRAG